MNTSHLNYHHLRLFWEVARAGSLRAASARLRLSQPSISAQIKALENSLETQLFERTGRGLKLTVQGTFAMNCSAKIFSLGQEMLKSLDGQGSGRNLRLNIGITDAMPKLVAWRIIRLAIIAFPDLRLSCVEGHARELLGGLASGTLDVVLSDEAESYSMPTEVFIQPLGKSPVVFCSVPALAKKLKASFPASLEDAPVLLPASRTAWRLEIDHWFDSRRIRPRVVAEFDDAALMKTAAADGLGIAPIAASVLHDAVGRYGLTVIGKPANCGFSSYLITLERVMRHPALAIMTSGAKIAFENQNTARL